MIRYKVLAPDEYHLLDRFYTDPGCIRLDPGFSRVFAAIEDDPGTLDSALIPPSPPRVVAFIVLQLVAHAEPIYVEPAYRAAGVWQFLAAMLEAYCLGSGVGGVYTQPTTDKTRHMCEEMGWVEMEHPLYLRIFDPVIKAMLPGPIDRDEVEFVPPEPGEYLRENLNRKGR